MVARTIFLFLLVGLFGYLPASAAGLSNAISLIPAEVYQGDVVQVRVSGEDLRGAKGSVGSMPLFFFPVARDAYGAILGIDVEQKPGPLGLTVEVAGSDGRTVAHEATVSVKGKNFREEHLSVDSSFDRIDQDTWKRIRREQQLLAALWSAASPRRLWQGSFMLPVPGEVTAPFGRRRVVNGVPRSPHGGVDLRAALGEKVAAVNDGKVVLREEMFFAGKSLVLDHGEGLYSMYFHLSEFHVEQGQFVRKGGLIGRAGQTGRVTGPHLHWGIRINGARVDPFAFIKAVGSLFP